MRYVWISILVLVVGLIIGADLLWNGLFGTSMTGSVSASGPEIGNWTLTPDICRSGDRRNFFGVQLFSKHDSKLALLYVEDPIRGVVVSANVPGTDYAYRFSRKDCTTLDGSLQRGPLINYVRAINGNIDIDCQTNSAKLKGHLTFKNCD